MKKFWGMLTKVTKQGEKIYKAGRKSCKAGRKSCKAGRKSFGIVNKQWKGSGDNNNFWVGNSNSVTSNFCLQISRNTKWIAFSTLLSWSSLSQSKLKMEEKVRKSERTKICQNKLKKEKELKIRRNKNVS